MITLLFVLAVQAAPQEPGWKNLYKKDGITLDSRTKPTKGSPYFEYRAQSDTDVDVDTLCREVFEWTTTSTGHDDLTSREVLDDSANTRVVYDQLKPPVVAHRDYAFTAKRSHDGSKSCHIEMTVTNDKAPPLEKGFVRIEKMKSSWDFQQTDSGAHVIYMLFSDPGAGVPVSMVHHAQQLATWNTVKLAVQAAHTEHAQAKN